MLACGFATGDYKVNLKAPIQVVVAEILWNRIFGDRVKAPADMVVMDEGHHEYREEDLLDTVKDLFHKVTPRTSS